jgi:hypothetical protein
MTATRSNFGKYKINNEIKGQINIVSRTKIIFITQTDTIHSGFPQMIIHSQI